MSWSSDDRISSFDELDISNDGIGYDPPRPRRRKERSIKRKATWATLLIAGCAGWAGVLVAFAAYERLTEAPPREERVAFRDLPRGDAPKVFEVLDPQQKLVEQRAALRRAALKTAPPLLLPGAPIVPAVEAPPRNDVVVADGKCEECQRLGTDIPFVREPAEAFKLAKEQKKLVYLLHLAGNFDDRGFTWNNAEALRVGALAKRDVAAFVNEHCVATYMKVGTFEKVGDQKNGGNVASYFCLYDGSVLHAVPGPVDARHFLSEARWAVETRRTALTLSTRLATGQVNMERYQRLVAQAHEERYFDETSGRWGRASQSGAALPNSFPMHTTQQAQVHWLLATSPLANIDRVYPTVWRDVLNERLSGLPVAQR